ncbi:nucleotidyltransferase family protein [Phenylobacterium sp.]|uniref:nucleotidyltransferase family protein n=1 Tax=Phenylobacterium sp. TaxID=1871053 RepID=UPI002C8839F3|nr:nucleotidyltransferase family protein [Phenylobacterium sp.]HVI30617.1 nucleotidyltransferase family protein [Phenylobacterium sp.]
MWGIIPAAGQGTRIQPLAFSKELLPVGVRRDGGTERPRAVSEYLLERLALGGATKVCLVISPHKADILRYYGDRVDGVDIAYVVQPRAAGLCDALFRACPLVGPDEPVAVGLPDTIWFPEDGLARLPDDRFSFLTFPVDQPQHFDAVVAGPDGRISQIQVKAPEPASRWIWGAFKMPGRTFHELHALWRERDREDEYLGTLVNAWIARGGEAWNAPLGTGYVDVGTLHGYREALTLLGALEPTGRP